MGRMIHCFQQDDHQAGRGQMAQHCLIRMFAAAREFMALTQKALVHRSSSTSCNLLATGAKNDAVQCGLAV